MKHGKKYGKHHLALPACTSVQHVEYCRECMAYHVVEDNKNGQKVSDNAEGKARAAPEDRNAYDGETWSSKP